MRLSELIEAVRHRVNDADRKYNTDPEITAWLNRHQRSLIRRKVEADLSYADQPVNISASDSSRVEQIFTDVWRYYLPSWVYRVRRVMELSGTTILRELQHGQWVWSSNRSIDIKSTAALNLRIGVAKVPALMRPLTVASSSTLNSEVVVAKEDGTYPFETEDGCMLGAQLELTSSESGRDPRGGVHVVVSQRGDVVDGAPVWILGVRPLLADLPAKGDIIQMHSEIEDVHAIYLINLVAHDIFQRKQNMTALSNMRPELDKCERDFIVGLQPRTDGVITTINLGGERPGSYNPDTDPSAEDYEG